MCEFEDRQYEGALEIDFSLLVEVQGNLVFEAFYYFMWPVFFLKERRSEVSYI